MVWKDEEGHTLEEYVERYVALGWNIFPVAYATKGGFLGPWKEYITRKQTPDEIRANFKPYYESGKVNIALIIGRTSNNTVVTDFDGIKLHEMFESLLPPTMISFTGSQKGFHHIYTTAEVTKTDQSTYTHEKIKPHKGKIGDEDHIDLQGEGAIIILPPSMHDESGKRYQWLNKDWWSETPAEWYGPFHETFRALAMRRLKLTKSEANEINVTRLAAGCFGKGEARPVREFEYLTWMKTHDVSEDEMWETIQEWNETLTPPLEEKKLRAQYDWVCQHEPYKLRFVEKDVKIFPTKLLDAARAILEDPTLEAWTQKTLDSVIYREYNNRMVAFYELLTGKMKGGKWKTLLIIKGDPGGGKTHLADALTSLFLTLKRARFTERAIDYMDKKIKLYEILYLKEFGGGQEQAAQGGISTLKFLGADDKGYVVEVYVKDPQTGEPTTIEKHIPPITIVTTSIVIEIEKQFASRALSLNVDDSLEQTMGILAFKSKREHEETLEFLGLKKQDESMRTLEAAVSLLESCEISLLFADSIIGLFKGAPSVPLRIRGDYDKLITLVKMRAFWHQKQRPWIGEGKKKIIFALPEDLIETLKYAKETILEMTSGLEKRLTDAIPAVLELKGNAVHIGGDVITGFTLEDFRRKYCPRSSYQTASRILEGLADAGVLSYTKDRGQKIYETLIGEHETKIGEPEPSSHAQTHLQGTQTLAISKMATSVQAAAEKEFETKFSDLCRVATTPIYIPRKTLELSPSLQRLFKEHREKCMIMEEKQDKTQVSGDVEENPQR
jgi:hypothetical protein